MHRFSLFLILAVWVQVVPGADRPPNIIHILADDLGYDDIAPYGAVDIPTPNLDRLARAGMRFTSFYAPGAVCTPSRASILTGCYAPRVSLPTVLFPFSITGLNPAEITIAELLKSRGYSTALVGKWHLGHQRQFNPVRHGFDYFFGTVYPNDHEPVRLIWANQAKAQGYPGDDWRPPSFPLFRNEGVIEEPAELDRCPHRFTMEAVKFIKENRNRPFYLHLANIETHTPYFVASRFQGFTGCGAYCDAVVSLDWTVGEIEATLIQLGLLENTLLVFSSDNGPLLQNHNDLPKVYGRYGSVNSSRQHLLRGAKGSIWEGGVRVPCLMRWQGRIPAGKSCDEIAAGFDLYSTFAQLAGASLPPDRIVDGKDISPLMFAETGARSPHDFFYYWNDYRLGAVRDRQWKLMLPAPPNWSTAAIQEPELYDLQIDPGETRNLAASYPETVQRLLALADKAREDLGDTAKNMTGKNRRPAGKAGSFQE